MGNEYLILKVPTLELQKSRSTLRAFLREIVCCFIICFFIAVKFIVFFCRLLLSVHVVCHPKDSLSFWFGVSLVCEPFLHDPFSYLQRAAAHARTPEMVLSLTVAGPGVALIWRRASAIQSWSANKSKKERGWKSKGPIRVSLACSLKIKQEKALPRSDMLTHHEVGKTSGGKLAAC